MYVFRQGLPYFAADLTFCLFTQEKKVYNKLSSFCFCWQYPTQIRRPCRVYHNDLLNLCSELGCQLMQSGAEIYRVEDSIDRLMQAYGVTDAQVFAIPSCLIISLPRPEGQPITRLCRIPAHGIDLDHLELCNALCRKLCTDVPPPDQARSQVAQLYVTHPRYGHTAVLLGHVLAAAFFTIFFGGTAMDALCGGLCGLAVGLANRLLIPITGSNSFFRTILVSMISSLLAQFLVLAGLGHSADTITIGTLMLLVPGVALTTAMREIMAGDLLSGISHTADSLLTATAIALGTGAALALGVLL